MTRLFIENKELDITQNFSQQITYAVDDLQNMDSKATSFTKTIVLPGTANNNRLLGNIFEFGNANFTIDSQPNVGYNFNAAKSAQARIEVDGLPVMKGVIRLLEILIDEDYIEYEVALFGELGGLFFSLGAAKLEQLDFSVYNHSLTIQKLRIVGIMLTQDRDIIILLLIMATAHLLQMQTLLKRIGIYVHLVLRYLCVSIWIR